MASWLPGRAPCTKLKFQRLERGEVDGTIGLKANEMMPICGREEEGERFFLLDGWLEVCVVVFV